jgi:hypothetical protein
MPNFKPTLLPLLRSLIEVLQTTVINQDEIEESIASIESNEFKQLLNSSGEYLFRISR